MKWTQHHGDVVAGGLLGMLLGLGLDHPHTVLPSLVFALAVGVAFCALLGLDEE